ncbi:MAG TPA: hypothetical protein DCP32_07655 [Anaerolineaceae bacterium]|nr:MAG: hypothetical protein A2X24_04005 [Chloroflexi bacterium GWB2_54_36]HAL16612.1 hypothetical protein [Anaerolineaceae bacterium]HBA91910.1 hypothetical protein [Anaerolineaceae bacterium]
METVVTKLLESDEPAIHYKARCLLVKEEPDSPAMQALQEEIRTCERVKQLLSERNVDGRLPYHPYTKWVGAHWVLTILADLEYPKGDVDLIPLREQVYGYFFSGAREKPIHKRHIIHSKGLIRACASIEGNAILSLLKLGIADSLTDYLAEIVLGWRWPDGGWNCDRKPQASHSSFHETLIPLRALNLYATQSGDSRVRQAVEEGAEVFLKRGLFRRLADGEVIDPHFIELHYPYYWHYNILYGLKVMGEIGCLGDPRCREALDLLESKRLPDGGYPAERRYYSVTHRNTSNRSLVDWGGTSSSKMNEWITVETLAVLTAAGRFKPIPA